MKIAIIVDDLNSDRRRYCFWEERLSSLSGLEVELVSLSHQKTEQKFFNIYYYDIIIFNWDTINNDVMFNSDRNQTIVKNSQEHFTHFVREGGILIMENQARYWHPVQDAYDSLLSGQVTVPKRILLENEEPSLAATARINKQHKNHPLIHNLPSVLHSAYLHVPNFDWFPPGTVGSRTLQGLHPTKIYSGAFQRWNAEWLPLLYTDDGKHPIMLVKTDGLGLWVVSTMYLASSNIIVLIENLIKTKNNLPAIRQYHTRYRRVRVAHALRAIAALIVVVIAVYTVLTLHIITLDIPFSNSLGGNIIISLLITFLLWILSRLFNFILSSLRLAFNK